MQIPFMITQHGKHKASALITSTHPPTTVFLPTSVPEVKKRVGGGGVVLCEICFLLVVYFMFRVHLCAALGNLQCHKILLILPLPLHS